MDAIRNRVSRWAIVLAGMLTVGILAAGGASAASTYTVTFSEVGLPSGASWSVTFNSVTTTASTANISISSLSASSYYWSITSPISGGTGIQYVTSQSGYMSVPNQVAQVVVFQKQVQVAFAVSPSGEGYTSPSGTTYYAAGAEVPIAAPHYNGYAFVKWTATKGTATFQNATWASTMATMKAPGTITAHFKALSSKVAFSEVGLPSGTSWSVTFNSVSHIGSTSTLSVGSAKPGSYSWTIPPVSAGTGVQYAPSDASGSISVPYQTLETVVFVKQYQVAFAVSPSGAGSTSPSSTTYYTAGSNVSIDAISTSTTAFTAWGSSSSSITFANKTYDGTTASIGGAGTLTAKFATRAPCSSCTVVFNETGLPSGTFWGITFGGQFYGGSSAALSIPSVTSSTSWSVSSPVSSSTPGLAYVATPTSGYLYVPGETHQVVVFVPEYYVNVITYPSYAGSAGVPSGTVPGYFPAGSTIPVASSGSDDWAFKSWSANTTSLVVASSKSAATTVTVNGPGTITATFAPPMKKMTFVEFGLPKGMTWGVDFNSVTYYTNQSELNLTGIAASSYSWSVVNPLAGASAGAEWVPTSTSGSTNVVYQNLEALVFGEQFQVTIQTGGTSGGSVSPSGSSWYASGTVLPIVAVNGTSVSFTGWSSSASGVTLASTSNAATTATVKGSATLTATFA